MIFLLVSTMYFIKYIVETKRKIIFSYHLLSVLQVFAFTFRGALRTVSLHELSRKLSGPRKYRKYIGKSTHTIRISRDYVFQRWASLIAQLVKNPPAKQETPVQFLGWEDPLEKG